MIPKSVKDYVIIVLILTLFWVSIFAFNIKNNFENYKKDKIIKLEKIDRNYLWNNFKLRDYSQTDFKITSEWKDLIQNVRNLKTIPTFIPASSRNKELCAWYIWIISEKIWGTRSPYYIWMANQKKHKPSAAWELPTYYEFFWWKQLIDFTWKFSTKDKDLYQKISKEDIKNFFLYSFSEEALLWDIWFLYKDSSYISFLNWWSSNSHITKNFWITDYEITVWEGKTELSDILWCDESIFKKVNFILENYHIYLNSKRVTIKNWEWYYINNNNEITWKTKIKFGDKISYRDISLVHFFEWRARVDSLFKFVCAWQFLPVNVISINSRFIEKM